MTKEELEKEAEEKAKKRVKEFACQDNCEKSYVMGALDFAEPRERHIAELKKQLDWKEKALSKAKKETKRIADRVNKDKRRLIRRKNELEEQIDKMKCCENCKYNSYWGNELHCNYGLKEAMQEDKLVECKDMDRWELAE